MSEQACYHCGLPVVPGDHYPVTILGAPRAMCCPGCQAVAETIVAMGMESYYQRRAECPPGVLPSADLVPEFLDGLAQWDDPVLQESFVSAGEAGQQEITLLLTGITCAACVWLIEKQLSQTPGVTRAHVNMSSHLALVSWDPQQTSLSAIIKAIARVGYKAEPYSPLQQEQAMRQENKQALIRIGVAGLGAMQVMMYAVGLYMGAFAGIEPAHEQFLRWVSALVATPVFFYSGMPFLQGAIRSLRSRHLSMDVPVALALCFAYFSSLWATLVGGPEVYFDSVCMFVFFLLVGRYLEMRARHRSQQTSLRLSHSTLQTARVLGTDGAIRLLPAEKLQPGDRVLVKPGETIPADGDIVSGDSAVSEAMLTGEHLPRGKAPGDAVIGGSLNVEQPLEIRVTHASKDSTLSALKRLLERAQAEKPATFLLADRIASGFVLAVLIIASLVYLYWSWRSPQDAFWIMLSVLVVTCPCALSLATPAAITAATARLAQLGFLPTRPHTVEALREITDVVFDKTGTLTLGSFRLQQTVPLGQLNADQALALAAGLEAGSEHPLARAFQQLPNLIPARIDQPRIVANAGVEGYWEHRRLRLGKAEFAWPEASLQPPAAAGQWVLLATPEQPLAWFRVEDEVRPDAPSLIRHLQRAGKRCHILSGDSSGHPQQLAADLGIDAVVSNVTPEQKLAAIRNLQQSGARVLMIGDGLNDAPVLAGADVSVAVAGATDLAQIAADAVLLSQSLQPLAAVLELVAKTYRIIRQNLAWAIGYNLLALPLAAAGFIPPWASALGMSASSLLVVLNAMRLNRGASSPQTGSGRIATTQDHAPRQPGSEAESWT